MEPVEATVEVRYLIFTVVRKIEEIGDRWFMQFEGSWESLNFGGERPPFNPGDRIKIMIEKVI